MDEVRYIGKQKRDIRLGKGLLIGGTALAIIGAVVYHDLRKGYGSANSENSSAIIREAHEYRVKSLDERLRDTLAELNSNPEDMERNYGVIADAVGQRLAEHPDTANRLVVSSLNVLNGNISQDAYMAMFEEIKKKAEENPELMDYFGENANAYMEKRFTEKYVGKLGEAVRGIKERSKSLWEALRNPKGGN